MFYDPANEIQKLIDAGWKSLEALKGEVVEYEKNPDPDDLEEVVDRLDGALSMLEVSAEDDARAAFNCVDEVRKYIAGAYRDE